MEEKENKTETFTDLAPISRDIESSIYQKAFDFCLGRKEISNIALTGPYGSGKSSIIRGLIDQKDIQQENSTLEISLASFESTKDIDDKQIELSILQQMIYSSSASQLPKSRFKRIRTPKNSTLVAISSLAWVIGFILLFSFWKEIFSIELWTLPFFIVNLLTASFLVISYKLIKTLYENVYGSSFKKISLKNIEVEKGDEENSILNKYLDEILYFFEMTNYKLVIFEDIDRFDSPDIFTKLREINTLINQNEDIKSKRHIQFLYALKDSIFTENERTKFFEFIIPVIPVIGFSNSSDLLIPRIKNIPDLTKNIDLRFVEDVSEFLNDARLVNNIFNELLIYWQEVNDSALNVTSLFAIMVYKNVFGKDFEDLHHSKGGFFRVLS
ncbi:MAG: ATP-binding protein, partial [Paraglaciecola sp.]